MNTAVCISKLCQRYSLSRIARSRLAYTQQRTAQKFSSRTQRTPGLRTRNQLRYTPDLTEESAQSRHLKALPASMDSWFQTHQVDISQKEKSHLVQFITDFIQLVQDPYTRKVSIAGKTHEFSHILQQYLSTGASKKYIRMLYQLLLDVQDRFFKNVYLVLAQLMSQTGDAKTTASMLSLALQIHQQGKKGVFKQPHVSSMRDDLHQFIYKNEHDAVFELQILEASLLAAEAKVDGAIALYKRALPAAKEASRKNISATYTSTGIQGKGSYHLPTPWDALIDLYHTKTERASAEERASYRAEISSLIDIGLEADSAVSHWHAAGRAQQDHRQREMQGYLDERAKLTREGRREEHIGKSSAWLYHMTKAAASLMPDACTELAKFYWATEWRFLDDEPSPKIKPTPLDRYPAPISAMGIGKRLLQAIGLSYRAPTPHDAFKTVSLPRSLKERVMLAEFWLLAASKLKYAPAERMLVEIYSTKRISKNIATDARAAKMYSSRYSYQTKIELFDAIFDGTYDQPRDSELIDNPLYDPDKAKKHIAEALYALEALWISRKFDKSGLAELRMAFSEHEELPTLYEPDDIRKWLAFHDIFQLWQDEEDICREMHTYIRALCDEQDWIIYDRHNRLLYRPKLSS